MECDQTLIKPGEAFNEFAHQIFAQVNLINSLSENVLKLVDQSEARNSANSLEECDKKFFINVSTKFDIDPLTSLIYVSTKFDNDPLISLSGNAQKLLDQSEAMKWPKFSGAWPKVNQIWGVPKCMGASTKFEINPMHFVWKSCWKCTETPKVWWTGWGLINVEYVRLNWTSLSKCALILKHIAQIVRSYSQNVAVKHYIQHVPLFMLSQETGGEYTSLPVADVGCGLWLGLVYHGSLLVSAWHPGLSPWQEDCVYMEPSGLWGCWDHGGTHACHGHGSSALAKEWQMLESWMRGMPVVSFNGGHYDLQLIKPYLVCNYDAWKPPWLCCFRTYQGIWLALPLDGGYGDGDDHGDEMVSILKKGSSYLALYTQKLAFLDVCNYLPAGAFSYAKYLRIYGGPTCQGGKSFFPNMWTIWHGCAISCHPMRPFIPHCAAETLWKRA